jgi:hypothetical protein
LPARFTNEVDNAGMGARVPANNIMDTPLENLKALTAWDTEPELTETEVESLLDASAIADVDGLAPTDGEWTPTYNLNKAAATGWLIKAARASDQTAVDPPESGIVTSKVFDNCLRMSREYKAKATASVTV